MPLDQARVDALAQKVDLSPAGSSGDELDQDRIDQLAAQVDLSPDGRGADFSIPEPEAPPPSYSGQLGMPLPAPPNADLNERFLREAPRRAGEAVLGLAGTLGGAAEAAGGMIERLPDVPGVGPLFPRDYTRAVAGELKALGEGAQRQLPAETPRDFWAEWEKDPGLAIAGATIDQLPILGMLAITSAAGVPVFGSAAAVEGGAAFREARSEGAPEEQALAQAGVVGAINGALEATGFEAVLKAWKNPAGRRLLSRLATSMLSEGTTEGLQEAVQDASAFAIYAGEKGLPPEDIEALWAKRPDWGAAAIIGAVTGGAIGGASPNVESAAPAEPAFDLSEEDVAGIQDRFAPQIHTRRGMEEEDVSKLLGILGSVRREQETAAASQRQREQAARRDAGPVPRPGEGTSPGGGVTLPGETPPPLATLGDIGIEPGRERRAPEGRQPGEGRPLGAPPREEKPEATGIVRQAAGLEFRRYDLPDNPMFPDEKQWAYDVIQGDQVVASLNMTQDAEGNITLDETLATDQEADNRMLLAKIGRGVRELHPEMASIGGERTGGVQPGRQARVETPGADRVTELASKVDLTPVQPEVSRETPAAAVVAPEAKEAPKPIRPVKGAEIDSMPLSELAVDPDRFQYKQGTDARGVVPGTTTVEQWRPELAGVIAVWDDPEQGKTFVVNGHHRYDMARKAGVERLNVIRLDAKTAEEARAVGALINIAEGRGTAVDAAKFFRDTGLTEEEAKAEGLPLTEKRVDDGLALAGLDDWLFNQVAQEEFPLERGVIIGRALPNQEGAQRALVKLLDKEAKKGKRITNDVVRELADMTAGAGGTTETQAGLFGAEEIEQSFAVEKAQVLADIRKRLSREKNLFAKVAGVENAAELERAGNVIRRDQSAAISREAGMLLAAYDQVKHTTALAGPLNEAARLLATGKVSTKEVLDGAYEQVREALAEVLGTGFRKESVSGVSEGPGDGEAAGQGGLFALTAPMAEEEAAAEEEGPAEEKKPKRLFPKVGRPTGVELPEMVELAERLLAGKLPKVKVIPKPGVLGYFRPIKGGGAELVIDPRSAKNVHDLAAVLSHEMGHLSDFLDDETMQRGNLLGRMIKSAKAYMRSTVAALPENLGEVITREDRKEILKRARRRAKKENVSLKEAYAAETEEEAEARGLVTKAKIDAELRELSHTWRPAGDPNETKYRYSAKELYADAFSAWIRDPDMAERIAPTFFRSWKLYSMEASPESWRNLQDAIELSAKVRQERLEHRKERFYEMLREGQAVQIKNWLERRKPKTAKESLKAIIDQAMHGLVAKGIDIERAVKASKGKGIEAAQELHYLFAEDPYITGRQAVYASGFSELFDAAIQAAGIDRLQAAAILGLRRAAANETKAGPLGEQGEYAAELAQEVEKELSQEQLETLNQARSLWLDLIDEIVFADLEGVVDEEFLAKMRENSDYVRFEGVQHLEKKGNTFGPAHSALRRQVGSFQRIGDPVGATVGVHLSLIQWAHRQQVLAAMHDTFTQLQRADPSMEPKVAPAKRRGGRFSEVAPSPEMRKWQLVTFMRNGKTEGMWVDPNLAKSLEGSPDSEALRVWNKVAAAPVRAALIDLRAAFWFRNIIRDPKRTARNIIPGKNPYSAMAKAYWATFKAIPIAKRYLKSTTEGGAMPEVVRKMLLDGAMPAVVGHLEGQQFTTQDHIVDALVSRHGVIAASRRDIGTLRRALNKWTSIGSSLELASKIGAWQWMQENMPELGDREIAYRTRKWAGTPDVWARGTWHHVTNSTFLFSTVGVQGIKSDLEAAAENPADFWTKTAVSIAAKHVLVLGALHGLLGEWLKRSMEGIPSYHRNSGWTIPFGLDRNGKTLYAWLPMDHFSLAVSNITQALFTDDVVGNLLEAFRSASPFSDQSIHPFMQAMWGWAQFARGVNPHDHWRGRDVIPEGQWNKQNRFNARNLSRMSWWSWDKAGGSFLYSPELYGDDGQLSVWEAAQRIPVLGDMFKGLWRVSDFGLVEGARDLLEQEEASQDRNKQARDRMADEFVGSLEPGHKATIRQIKQLHETMEDLGIAYQSWTSLRDKIHKIEAMRAGTARDQLESMGRTKREKEILEEYMKERLEP